MGPHNVWLLLHIGREPKTQQLPHNWYQDNHFLGLAIGCVYSLVDDESYNESGDMSEDESDSRSENESEVEEFQKKSAHISLNCYMTINCHGLEHEDFMTFTTNCECYEDAKVSDETWVMYYPKVAIPENIHSNQWTFFLASFAVSDCFGKPLKVQKSVIGLVYDDDRAHQSRDVVRAFQGHGNSCSLCQSDREHKFKLCLEGSDFIEMPTIESPSVSVLETLCLRNCKNLEILPSEIFQLKSLKGLFFSGCSKLYSFPDITEDMENLRKLYLNATAIEELPSSIEHLQGLQELLMYDCINLVSLPESICNLRSLKSLGLIGCLQLNKLPENLGGLLNLEELYAAHLYSVSCQLPSLSGLSSLRILDLQQMNLMQGAIPSEVCCLSSLKALILSYCNIIEGGIPSEIYNLSSLQALYLAGNHFSSIPAGINKLSHLRVLNLGHCQKLQQIPELPTSLRFLDIHRCASLETLSSPSSPLPSCLFKCFKSAIQV